MAKPNPVLMSFMRDNRVLDKGAWVALVILCVVYALNFLDRQLLSILAKPIQDDLGVTDAQLGRISGFYFALFYCLISIPIGWLADRTNRIWVVSSACALWSAATMACGFTSNYSQLVVARMSVGVGEAGGVPPSYAIICDYFPPGRRGTALGFYNLGPPVGQALGVAFGASIAATYSWRAAFIVLGAAGIAAALIVALLVREPPRGGLEVAAVQPSTRDASPASFWATCRMFFSRPVLLLVALACGATQFVTYAVLNFTTLFLMREKGMSLQEIAIYYALLVGLGIGGGIFISGAAHRPAGAAVESRLRVYSGTGFDAGDSVLRRFCVGTHLAAGPWCFSHSLPSSITFISHPPLPSSRKRCSRTNACSRARIAAAGDEPHRSWSWPDLSGSHEQLLARGPP
jgi:predicted MFS family arabinose efflux permease